MFHIALFEPEIPPNTGNIIRLCANAGGSLHLIKPYGFVLDDKRLRRAGLDYHEFAHVAEHESYEAFRKALRPSQRVFAFTTHGSRYHTEPDYQEGDVFLFGPETRGLPPEIRNTFEPAYRIRIPMVPDSRSLNLSNSAAVALYEAWRQVGFSGA